MGGVGSAVGGVEATLPEARNRKRPVHKGRVMLAPTILGPPSIIAKQLKSWYWRGSRAHPASAVRGETTARREAK